MDENNQNKSPNENYLQILLEPIGSSSVPDSKVLTITQEKLAQLGVENHSVVGAIWTYDGTTMSNGIFNGDEVQAICNKIETILEAAIVNSDQRNAVKNLIENALYERQAFAARWTSSRIEGIENNANKAAGDNGLIIRSLA